MRELSGTIGKNDRKTKENHPSHSGSCQLNGKQFWISGWVKSNDRGSFLSLSFKAKEEQAPIEAAPFNDDIPF